MSQTHLRPRPVDGRARAAFTLLEIVVVIVLLLLVLAMGVPTYLRSQQKARLKEASTLVREDLLYARQLAVAGGASRQISFAGSGPSYSIRDGETVLRARRLPPGYRLGEVQLSFGENGCFLEPSQPAPRDGEIVIELQGERPGRIRLGVVTGAPLD